MPGTGRSRAAGSPVARALVVAAALTALAAGPGLASASTPASVGWWSRGNAGALLAGTPELAGPVGADVPPGGMLLQGSPDPATPTAYGALQVDVGPAAPTVLRLVRADAATAPVAPPLVCVLTESFTPVHGGPAADGPAFDCGRSAPGRPTADGSGFTFDVARLAESGSLALAVVPAGATDRIVLAPLGDGAVETAVTPGVPVAALPAAAAGASAPPPSAAPPAAEGLPLTPPQQSGDDGGAAAVAPSSADPPGPAPAVADQVAGVPAPPEAAPALPDEVATELAVLAAPAPQPGRRGGGRLALLALLVGGALWVAAGRSAAPLLPAAPRPSGVA